MACHRYLGIATASLIMASGLMPLTSVAMASTYSFSFTHTADGVTASGTLVVNGGVATGGTGTLTGGADPGSLTLMTESSPGSAGFITDPAGCSGGPCFSYRFGGGDLIVDNFVPLDVNGLLFGIGSPVAPHYHDNPGYLAGFNIWYNGGDSYTAALFQDNGSQNEYNGSFTLTATPLPATWTMMLIGLAGLGFIAYRQRRTVSSPAGA